MTTLVSQAAVGDAEPPPSVQLLEHRLAAAEAEIVRLTSLLAASPEVDGARDLRRDTRSSALLAAVVTASHDAIVSSDEHEHITTWNPGAERLFGFTAREAIGQRFSDLVPADQPDRRRSVIMDAVRAGATLTFDTRRQRKDGSLVEVETVVSTMRDPSGAVIGVTSITRDITERKAVERQLRELEVRYQTFFEQMPGLTYIHAPSDAPAGSGILEYSPQFTDVTGYAAELWMTDPDFAFKIAHPDDRAQMIADYREVAKSGNSFCIEFRIIAQDGRILWLRDQANLVYGEDGEPLYWLGFMLDISDQKRAEAATTDALARLEATNRELERLSAAKSDFVSTISHEFRTPLTSIQGFSELLETEVLSPEELRGFAHTINQSARRLARMVGDVLDLDSLEAGQHELRLEQLQLKQLVARVRTAMQPVAAGHQIVTKLDLAVPPIRGDADLLVRVLTNLVANAIKYSPVGGTITISLTDAPTTVELTVADQGLGIPPGYRESIFTRYGRIARQEQLGIEGTGLGLPIARQIVELHGGKIWVEANHPTGSVFHLTLPKDGPR